MIDPNIIFQGKTPVQNAQEIQNLNNSRNLGEIQREVVQSDQLANAQTIRHQAEQTALNQAISSNITRDPSGAPTINHEAVVATLSKSGFGTTANQYKEQMTRIDDSVGKLEDQRLATMKTTHDMVNSALGSILQAPPQQKQQLYQQKLTELTQQGLLKPGQYPDQVPPDSTIESMLYSSLIPTQQINAEVQKRSAAIAQQRADTQDRRADAADQRAEAYQESVTNAQDAKRYSYTGDFDKAGHPLVLDTKTGKVSADTSVTGSPDAIHGKAAATRQLTPDASLANQRANQTDYEKNANAELATRQQLTQLDEAIGKGSVYVDPKGNVRPFSTLKKADGSELDQQDIQSYRGQMQQRRQVLQTQIEQAVANKNDAMGRNGVRPQVSTQEAIAGYRHQAPAAAQSGGGVTEGTIIKNPKTGERRQFTNGAWKVIVHPRQ